MKTVCALFAAVLLLTSCMKSDDTTSTLYNDAAITGFTLGTLNRYLHTTSSIGADSIYKVTVAGSDYKMSIDHVNHLIFNVDSLPANTDVGHVVCSISSMNNGTVFIVDKEDSETLYFHSSTDSIDFSTPRQLLVYATDGVSHAEYTVQLNVHQEDSEQFNWVRHKDCAEMTGMENIKAVMVGENLYVFGVKEGETLGYMTTDGDSWTPLVEFDDAEASKNVVAFEYGLYTIANGSLLQSDNGSDWFVVNTAPEVMQLVAASYTELFGLSSNGTLMKSDDKGVTWTGDVVDSDKSWLPTEEVAYVSYPANMTYYSDYLLLAGVSTGVDKIASVWRKIVEYDLQGDEKWVYMDRNDNNRFALPQMENLVLMYYDDGILAWGVNDNDYTPIFQSRDNGIVWKENSRYQLPEDFDTEAVTAFGATTDGKEIWLIGGNGQVWQGHLNRVAWEMSE